MNLNDYQREARKSAFYPNLGENLQYPVLGLAGEAGEVANVAKKIDRDDDGSLTEMRRTQLKDELGDVLWYVANTAEELGLSLEDVANFNLMKLAKRHGEEGDE